MNKGNDYRCIGCGVKLQNTNSNLEGYTKKLDNAYCERCFKTIHYNEYHKVNNVSNEAIIAKINKLGFLIFFVTDIINLDSVINIFKEIKNEKILIINKLDIMPSNLKVEHLRENIKISYNLDNDIYFLSGKNKINLLPLIKKIKEKKKVIFCGETSSGKSTLINNLVGSNITTSKYDNTTLDFIKINYLDYVIYDTPGFLIAEDKELIMDCRTFTKQCRKDYLYIVGDISFKCDGNLTIFTSSNISIKSKKDLANTKYQIEIPSKSDILFNGGFIFVKNKTIIYTNDLIKVRKSIIGEIK